MHTRVAIVGGGLSGLALADHLHQAGQDFQLFEARARLGGRIKTAQAGGAGFDLGPSWFWPGQPRMAALVARLGVRVFDQYAAGAVSYETETGQVMRDAGFSSMQGSLRLDGGMAGLITGLQAQLPAARVHLNSAVSAISAQDGITLADGRNCTADQIIVATPPRVAADLAFTPALGPVQQAALRDIPTWMGGHAKFVAIYPAPFWRAQGLSGDAMSRRGPLAEIHDASAPDGAGPGALFGFLGIPAETRKGQDADVIAAALAQLQRIFGPEAAEPTRTFYQDWATKPLSATALDHIPPRRHPAYGMPFMLGDVWGGKLHFCSTELGSEMGGYLEGALSAAQDTARMLLDHRRSA